MNLKLKAKLVEKFRTQGAGARVVKLSESRVSRLINGVYAPTDRERQLLQVYSARICSQRAARIGMGRNDDGEAFHH